MSKKKKKHKTCILFIEGVPFDLKALFKAWCSRRGLSMATVIKEMMKEKIKEN